MRVRVPPSVLYCIRGLCRRPLCPGSQSRDIHPNVRSTRRHQRHGDRVKPARHVRPPGPPPLGKNPIKIYRFVRDFSRDPLAFVSGRFRAYGDLYFTNSRGSDLYVLRHPDHIHQVLVERAGSFAKRSEDLEPILGQGLLTSNGALWRRQRRLIQPSFQKQRIESYADIMLDAVERMFERWNTCRSFDLAAEMTTLTLDIVCKTLFDFDVSHKTQLVAEAMSTLQDAATNLALLPPWLPTPFHLRARRALARLDDIVFEMIDEARSDLQQARARDDLLARLARATDEEGQMSRQQLRDELLTMFLAGHETTSLALSWTFYLLSRNPNQRTRLHREIDEVLGDRRPEPADLDQLPLVHRVIAEALRLYPPAYVIPRNCIEDVEIGQYTIPAGSELVLWVWHCHHDPRWFDQPERFDPDRFLRDSGRITHPKAYLPFGSGARTCIGKHFATMEAGLLLTRIAQRATIDVDRRWQPALRPRVTLGPRDKIPAAWQLRSPTFARA